jgi:glycosyltransferase involved in cell wall biosynthesis
VKVAIVAPKVNLETGGGSHLSLVLYAAALQDLDCDVEVHVLNPASEATRDEFRRVGVPLCDVGGVDPGESVDRLGRLKSDVLLFDVNLPLSYRVKRRFPERCVATHLSTLSGFCTNVARQGAGCWLTCRHLDRVRHHAGSVPERLRYALTGAVRVADLGRGFRSLDGCIFSSPPAMDAYRIYRLQPDRCFLVPECIDVEHIRRFRAVPFASSGGPLTVLYVGTLARYKGLPLLFDALRRLSRPWRARIYGDGDDRERVLEFMRKFPDRVDYRGHVANQQVFEELHGGDFLFVHPCLWFESLGRGILEAMALEIPVVVPDVGGPSWSVTAGKTGLHYRHRDAADLARQIQWAAERPADMRVMAAAGREAVRHFDYRPIARMWRDTLVRIAERARADA